MWFFGEGKKFRLIPEPIEVLLLRDVLLCMLFFVVLVVVRRGIFYILLVVSRLFVSLLRRLVLFLFLVCSILCQWVFCFRCRMLREIDDDMLSFSIHLVVVLLARLARSPSPRLYPKDVRCSCKSSVYSQSYILVGYQLPAGSFFCL